MLEQLQALRALQEAGTTGRAATRLRVSQSAVSKRIAALEERVGFALLRQEGRNARLTPAAEALLEDVLPRLLEIEARLDAAATAPSPVRIAATESLVASWLPALLRSAADSAGATIEIHAHRGPLALERVRGGEVDLAIVVSAGEDGLRTVSLGTEPMVILASGFGSVPEGPLEVWTIEAGSLTGAWLARRLPRLRDPVLRPVARIESFASAVQLARAGFGHALVPQGIAEAMGAPAWRELPLRRPISMLGRPSAWERPAVRRLVEALRVSASR
jgi:DNA-binding transcriptional LysR family regulator